MKDAIAMDATEVAYFSSFRATPRIYKVAKHTATQVELEKLAGGGRFTRERGRPYGARFSDAYIENVTPAIRERIAAAELHDDAKAVFEQVWKLQEQKHGRERDALRKLAEGREGRKLNDVKAAVARLIEFAKHNFGVDIEVNVPVEKKA